MMKIHKISKADNDVVCGKTTICGLNTFYTTEETESKIWRNVTCKNCLKLRNITAKG